MNELLKKYYGLEIDYYRKYKDGIVFFINGDYYYFFKTVLEQLEIDNLYKLYLFVKSQKIILHDFIFNNDGSLLSEEYILIKLNYLIGDININDVLKFNILVNETFDLKKEFRKEWMDRIDYIERQVLELSNNLLINNSLDYFVGIAEVLLSFYNDNYHESNDNYVVHSSFKSLNTIDFYNPTNLSVGNKYKDIISYIKINNDWNLLNDVLNVSNLNDRNYIFVRLSFPFEYFYVVNELLIDEIVEQKLLNIINGIDDYENYLKRLEEYFGYKVFYWIKKDN